MAVAPVGMGWSDIGSWDALHDFAQEAGHAAAPDSNVVAINTEDCLIRSSGPLIAAVGLKDMIIVATDDAVMIAPRGRSQEVRHLVDELKRRGPPVLDHSASVEAAWESRDRTRDERGKSVLIRVGIGGWN